MNVGIVGTGYVGLVTGACLAELGASVVCADKDRGKVAALRGGRVPFYEPGLEKLVARNIGRGRLGFTSRLEEAIKPASAIFIAVGTPPRGDGSADLTYVREVAKEIARNLEGYKVIATKSTVPVGTCHSIRETIANGLKEHVDFDVVANPEFLREGAAIEDFMRPSRVVIGSDSPRAVEVMLELYRPLRLIGTPFVTTDIQSAELIKYASNCFLATKISFINEMANLCEELGGDVRAVARGMGLDGRIGPEFLSPGPGFGGSCFPKDTRALIRTASELGVGLGVVEAAVRANEAQKERMLWKARDAMGGLRGRTAAVLGLSFKPDTDDIRESPAVQLIRGLLEGGAHVRCYDPEAMENAGGVLKGVVYCEDPYGASREAEALIIVTEWEEFRNLDLGRIRGLMKRPCFLDLRNIYDPGTLSGLGFEYHCVGRAPAGQGPGSRRGERGDLTGDAICETTRTP
jgi:UDPglucose 6-dehydrogenase